MANVSIAKNTKKTIANRLRRAMKIKGINKNRDLWRMMGHGDKINQANNIDYWSDPNDSRCPNVDYLIELSKALNVSVDYLLGLAPDDSITNNWEARQIADKIGLPEETVFSLINDSSKYHKYMLSIIIKYLNIEGKLKIHEIMSRDIDFEEKMYKANLFSVKRIYETEDILTPLFKYVAFKMDKNEYSEPVFVTEDCDIIEAAKIPMSLEEMEYGITPEDKVSDLMIDIAKGEIIEAALQKNLYDSLARLREKYIGTYEYPSIKTSDGYMPVNEINID